MLRKIVSINEEKCNGCGACVKACHEGAIKIENGKAILVNDSYCDGLGDCLPACPMDALVITEKDVIPYALKSQQKIEHSNWPMQMKLISPQMSFLEGADLVIAASCTAFASPHFHQDFGQGKTLIIGCPKLDGVDYSIQLAQIMMAHTIQSITLVRMEVPCCGGLVMAVQKAMTQTGCQCPFTIKVISTNGEAML